MDATRRMYESEQARHRDNAFASLDWLERHLSQVRRALEGDSPLTLATGAARNATGPLSELTTSLAHLQTLDEWRFAVVSDEDAP